MAVKYSFIEYSQEPFPPHTARILNLLFMLLSFYFAIVGIAIREIWTRKY
nr:MAG TPA: hypothetical protein [Caudoviricetes sp.]